jgi:iron(III) transport system permease protein
VVVGLVLLPAAGLYLAYLSPPGLVEPPPLSMGRVWPLLGRTLALATMVSLASLALGTWLAWVETRAAYRGRAVLAALSVLPLATPSYLLAAIVREEMAPAGLFGRLLGTEGQFTGFWPSVLVLTLACTPYVHLLVAAALQRCPLAEEEAARSLGARGWRLARAVWLPRLRPTWAFALVLVGLYVISDFGAVAVLDCEVLTWELYKVRGGRDAIVLGFGIVLAVVPLLVAIRLLHGRGASEATMASPRVFRRTPLTGPALLATWAAHLLLIGLAVALPAVILARWLLAGVQHGAAFAAILGPAVDTLVFALVGGVVVLLAAFAPAWIVARGRARGRRLLEHGVIMVSALPGMLVAVGILHLVLGLKREVPIQWGGGSAWTALEAGGVFLVVAYVMRFLSQAYAALSPAIQRLDVRQEESARSLGAGRWRRFRTISAPALTPGALAAMTLLFLSIAKELPITYMLLPLGHTTLAFRVFDAQQEGSLPDVGAAGLILLVFALMLQVVLSRWRRHV